MVKTRIVTRIGDIFEVPLDAASKRYIQYIAIDQTQLNSSVIRAFKKVHLASENPSPDEIVKDEVDFNAHTVLRAGIVQNLWKKIGKSKDVGSLNILFRGTNDILDPTIKVSENWHVWKISGPPKKIGRLIGEYEKAEIGSVLPANFIVERMKTGTFGFVYPAYS